jgi:hypothetical protein
MSVLPRQIDCGVNWAGIGIDALSVGGAWFLVVLGWAVANDLAAQRERQKHDLGRLAELRGWLAEVERLGVEYHTNGYAESLRRDVTRKIKQLGIECSHLERGGLLSSEWRGMNNELRRAVTWSNFDQKRTIGAEQTKVTVEAIEGAVDRFQAFMLRSLESRSAQSETLRATLLRILRKL